ncbi:hypothetical protein JCM8097_007326 [Rhodosporidiobolus ruineniae]
MLAHSERGPCLIGPSPEAEVEEYLKQYKPSANAAKNGPWYWVQLPRDKDRGEDVKEDEKPAEEREGDDVYSKFEKEGQKLVDEMTDRCQWIKENAPVRGKKKEGIKSQKELREEEHAKFNDKVRDLAKKHKLTSGKWLFFNNAEYIDSVWAKIVRAIALKDGPLAKAGVNTAKVSTSLGDGPNYVICVYCNDSWDEAGVAKVFKTLVSELHLISSAYKCDANTILGIASGHPSGIKTSLYGKTTFMTQAEIDAAMAAPAAKSKAKEVQRKTKDEENGGFESDSDASSDADDKRDERPRKTPGKAAAKDVKSKQAPKKQAKNGGGGFDSDSGSDASDGGRSRKRRMLAKVSKDDE